MGTSHLSPINISITPSLKSGWLMITPKRLDKMSRVKNGFNKSVKHLFSNSNHLKAEHYTRTFIINNRIDGFKPGYSTCIIMAYPIKRVDLIRKQSIRKKIMGL